VNEIEPARADRIQFSLRGLFILQAVCAVFLAALVTAGVFAVLAAFAATLVVAWARIGPEHRQVRRLIVDLMGGAVLPALCLLYDPAVFRAGNPLQGRAYLFILFEIGVLLGWMVFGRWLGRLATPAGPAEQGPPAAAKFAEQVAPRLVQIAADAIIAGAGSALMVGAVAAFVIGFVVLPLSVVGILAAGVGLLGLVPFLTCLVFGRQALRALRQSKRGNPIATSIAAVLGTVFALAVPTVVYSALGPLVARVIAAFPFPESFFPFLHP
jgi:hypothetical protein